jgi:DNA-binding transcriptional LysR family regulator
VTASTLDLRLLRCFVVLAEELHFGNAARRLHMTQPPLSVKIKQLEELLGARMFVRDSRTVRLTTVGKAFLPDALRVLSQAESTIEAGRALASGKTGNLHLGFTSSMLFRGLPQVLRTYKKAQPGVEVHCHDLTAAEQALAVRQRRLDGGFSPAQTVAPGLTGVALAPDVFTCCLHEAHPLAGKRRVDLRSLTKEDFILFSREVTTAGYDHLMSMCLRAGFRPRERVHVRQWLTAVMMVSHGMGVAVVPGSIKGAGVPGVRFVPIDDADANTSGFFIWDPESISPPLAAMIAHVRNFVSRP